MSDHKAETMVEDASATQDGATDGKPPAGFLEDETELKVRTSRLIQKAFDSAVEVMGLEKEGVRELIDGGEETLEAMIRERLTRQGQELAAVVRNAIAEVLQKSEPPIAPVDATSEQIFRAEYDVLTGDNNPLHSIVHSILIELIRG